jgi:peptide/nickel transport system ATP-binding protein
MVGGRIVETGARAQVFGDPRHPYTRRLLAAAPVPDPDAHRPPIPEAPPPVPDLPLREVAPGHFAAL